jgi:hypothetical protein
MCAAADPTEAAVIAAALDAPVKLRLFRDYPDYRHLLVDNVELSAEELDWINTHNPPKHDDVRRGGWMAIPHRRDARPA